MSLIFSASMRMCMGARRGFICRMKVGSVGPESLSAGHLNRLKQRNSLGPSRDGHNYAVVHCTGYIKNWPPTGQFDTHPLSGNIIFLPDYHKRLDNSTTNNDNKIKRSFIIQYNYD